MIVSRLTTLVRSSNLLQNSILTKNLVKTATSTKHGVILQEPQKTRFGFLKMILTVVSGLLIGAAISKNIANFLEENDLFVPSDDDDDDD
ncbi:essential MCU regulator, mitochondrial [Anoplophora glabripennis]|nr:essential MCU regulator, mitochondrial [Anoplophora glabripennis]